MYQKLLDNIDAATLKANKPTFRNHLGGSLIGRDCSRQIWLGFRWAKLVEHKPRMLRLFARGQNEEAHFVDLLRRAGVKIKDFSERLVLDPIKNKYYTQDWNDPVSEQILDVSQDDHHIKVAAECGIKLKQWRISDINGHLGGSLDGVGSNFPDLPPDWEGLLEFKTHNTKSFVKLTQEGVKIAKPEHYKQMQIYMHKKGLRFAIYGAVNKNDDDLWWGYVEYDEKEALKLLEKARTIIHTKKPPDRISNNPSWFGCKFCDFHGICHMAEPMLKNCRTCEKSTPVENGEWFCSQWNNTIPVDFILKGCDNYKAITD